MKPSTKEYLVLVLEILLAFFVAATVLVGVMGCSAAPIRHTSAPDTSISQAAAISDQIDGKAVLIQQWLKQNH